MALTESDFLTAFSTHRAELIRVAALFVGRTDAEDVVQDTFLTMWRTKGYTQFNGDANIKTWLSRSVMRRSWQWCKKRTKPQQDELWSWLTQRQQDDTDSERAALRELAYYLPRYLRAIFLLRLSGLNIEEIAWELNMPKATAHWRLKQIVKMLQWVVEKEGLSVDRVSMTQDEPLAVPDN